ncbi:MAG: hypothetical protein HQK81_03710 [Desulfovibrionaceae bacterium]|nr:hypothetical protein [Desulfovibrionaceae bacterium]MBF0513149.1 hypothetical protein [Desulfovibrionaceae bacterium]
MNRSARILTARSLGAALLTFMLCFQATGATGGPGAAGASGPTGPAGAAPAGGINDWRLIPAGYGGGGRFTALALDPSSPDRLVVGSDVAGYFIPGPDGREFMLRGKELGGLAVSALAFDPGHPGVVAVQCDAGLYLSRDGGKTATLLNAKLGYASRFFGGKLLLFAGPALIVATDTKGVFSQKWETPGAPETPIPGLEGIKVNSLAMWAGALFAATDKGVYRVQDNRFVPAGAGLSPEHMLVSDLAADPKSGLFAVVRDEGLVRFDPAKNAWTKPGPSPAKSGDKPIEFKALGLDPAKPGRVFMATDPSYWPNQLFISEDSGATWTVAANFALAKDAPPNWTKGLESVEAIAFSQNGENVYVSDWWNVWRSSDGGASFTQLHKGLQNTVVNALAFHPDKPETILMGTADNGIMRSTDGGATWARSMSGVDDGDAMAVRFAKNDPQKAYFLFSPWNKPKNPDSAVFFLCKSLDAGATWKTLTFTVAARKLAPYADGRPTALRIDPRDEDVVYVGSNGHGLYRVNTALLAEGKAKEAVENVGSGLPLPNFPNADSLLIAPDNPNKLYASTLGGGVWTSENAGRSWLPASPRWNFTFGLAADPSKPGRVFAGVSEKRLVVTEDGGRAWKEIVLPGERPAYVATQVVAVDPANADIVYAGTSAYDLKAADGLYVSLDGGKSFAQIHSELPRANITCLAPAPGGPLVGANGLCIFRLKEKP